jgi:hypothetical protein
MSPNPNITIAVHHISRGAQPGPYAPHVYESFLVVSGVVAKWHVRIEIPYTD